MERALSAVITALEAAIHVLREEQHRAEPDKQTAGQIGLTTLRRSGSVGVGGSETLDIPAIVEPRRTAPAATVTEGGPAIKLAPATLQIEQEAAAWETELLRLKRSPAYQKSGPAQVRAMSQRFGWAAASDATSAQILTWVIEQGGAGHTQNNRFSMASTFFEFCRRVLKTLRANPCDDIPRSPKEKGEGVREFTPDEIARVVAAANGNWRTACIIFATTALRRGSVFRGIRCGWFNRKRRQIELPPGFLKNKKKQRIALNDDAVAAIEAASRGKRPDDYIVPTRFDDGQWAALLKRAGVAYEDDRGLTAGTHSFRKGAATTLAEAGVHPKVAQELLGHSDIRLTMGVYTRLGEKHQEAAVRLLHIREPGFVENPGELTNSRAVADDPPSEAEAFGVESMMLTPISRREDGPPRSKAKTASEPLSIGDRGPAFTLGSGFESPSGSSSPQTCQTPRLGLEPGRGASFLEPDAPPTGIRESERIRLLQTLADAHLRLIALVEREASR